jgi:hypothetical protein
MTTAILAGIFSTWYLFSALCTLQCRQADTAIDFCTPRFDHYWTEKQFQKFLSLHYDLHIAVPRGNFSRWCLITAIWPLLYRQAISTVDASSLRFAHCCTDRQFQQLMSIHCAMTIVVPTGIFISWYLLTAPWPMLYQQEFSAGDDS